MLALSRVFRNWGTGIGNNRASACVAGCQPSIDGRLVVPSPLLLGLLCIDTRFVVDFHVHGVGASTGAGG